MNRSYLLGLGAVVLLALFALALITFQQIDPYAFPTPARGMVTRVQDGAHLLTPATVEAQLAAGELQVVDLRDPKRFAGYHLEGAVNIPLDRILDADFEPVLNSGKPTLLVSADGQQALQAWVLLTQYGYENLFVLEGGVDHWQRHMDAGPMARKPDFRDEVALFDYKERLENGPDPGRLEPVEDDGASITQQFEGGGDGH
ncbi:MAG: rhodanese-like domain-containing protein [Bacteroidetes bacterium]|nr:MAG: rhodanese-like domain-containing protein [Bacteroidota bacterium]